MTNIRIEVVIDQAPGHQVSKHCSVAEGTTIVDLLQEVWLQDSISMFEELSYGVYAKKVGSDYVLQANDRLEFYRPLLIGPKEARRLRAKKQEKNNSS